MWIKLFVSVVLAGYVSGVACLDNLLYLVCRLSNSIHVFTPDMSKEIHVITIEGMRFPLNIIACAEDRLLYVADSGNTPAEECVWRVSAEDECVWRVSAANYAHCAYYLTVES